MLPLTVGDVLKHKQRLSIEAHLDKLAQEDPAHLFGPNLAYFKDINGRQVWTSETGRLSFVIGEDHKGEDRRQFYTLDVLADNEVIDAACSTHYGILDYLEQGFDRWIRLYNSDYENGSAIDVANKHRANDAHI